MTKARVFALCGALVCGQVGLDYAHADVAKGISDYGLPVMGLTLAAEGLAKEGKEHRILLKGVEAVVAAALTTEALKSVVRERRPNGSNFRSFPSGHAAGAFAIASVMGREDKKHKWLWYGAASALAWSRVSLRAHRTHDVVAGAAIGYLFGDKAVSFNARRDGIGIAWWRTW